MYLSNTSNFKIGLPMDEATVHFCTINKKIMALELNRKKNK